MVWLGIVLLALAALIHVYIFVLESLLWTTERARTIFGTTPEEAETTKLLAFNQGVYNLCPAVVVAVGIVIFRQESEDVGIALAAAGGGTMIVAGCTLFVSSPEKARSAILQLAPPLFGLLALGFAYFD